MKTKFTLIFMCLLTVMAPNIFSSFDKIEKLSLQEREFFDITFILVKILRHKLVPPNQFNQIFAELGPKSKDLANKIGMDKAAKLTFLAERFVESGEKGVGKSLPFN